MKLSLIGIVWLLIHATCSAGTISGQLSSATGIFPKYIFLRSFLHPSQEDTVAVNSFGGFKLKLNSPEPGAYMLQYGHGAFNFFYHPSETSAFVELTVKDGNIDKGTLQNSKEDKAFADLQKVMGVYDNELYKLINMQSSDSVLLVFIHSYNYELNNFQNFYRGTYVADTLAQLRKIEVSTGKSAIDILRSNFFNQVNFSDTSLLANPVLNNMIDFYAFVLCDSTPQEQEKFISTLMNRTGVNLSAYKTTCFHLFNQFLQAKNEPMLKSFFNWFSAQGDSAAVPVIKAKIAKLGKSLSGQAYIPVQFKDAQGNFQPLGHSVANNKYTLLVIWESTCAHCRETIPKVKDLYLKYRDKGLNVYAVSLDENENEWRSYVEQNQLNWQNVYAGNTPNMVLDDYYLNSLPVLVLIDAKGIIQQRFASPVQLDVLLAAYLK